VLTTTLAKGLGLLSKKSDERNLASALEQCRNCLKTAVETIKTATTTEPEAGPWPVGTAATFAEGRSADILRRLRTDHAAIVSELQRRLR
jgi:hypothetical protein